MSMSVERLLKEIIYASGTVSILMVPTDVTVPMGINLE